MSADKAMVTDAMVKAAVAAVSDGVDWVRGLFGLGYGSAEDVMRDALSAALAQAEQPVAVVRHKKRGSEYEVIGFGKMQADNWWERNPNRGQATFGQCDQLIDMREVAIYRSIEDGALWVRPREEFEDGRFEAHPPAKRETGETAPPDTPPPVPHLSGWQPIETAPRDETRVLLYGLCRKPSVDAGKPAIVIGYWTNFNTGGWVWYGASMEFTHWQPLPATPATTEGSDND